MVKISLVALTATVLCTTSSAFTPSSNYAKTSAIRTETSLNMAKSNINGENAAKAFTSAITAGFLLANLAIVDIAEAYTPDFGGSSDIVAARSGGRAGGRASSGRASSTSLKAAPRSQTTVINQAPPTVIVNSPPVMSSPMMMAPVYDPTPAIGLSLGLSAVNGIANGMREAGQERELARNRAELEQAKMKEADMEARLRMLEYQQRMPAPQ